jgi:hypothetical protein
MVPRISSECETRTKGKLFKAEAAMIHQKLMMGSYLLEFDRVNFAAVLCMLK